MDTQTILVFAIFALAVFYVSRLVYRSIFAKKGCASNCGKCSADFSHIPTDKK
ncbi:FeoB-associated Cys-rich membrane protein [Pseudopedobacter saltans]|uniref:FeoB-associated Cys-rich membrane protein n=1 Tax=Pseudopedobacter saltans TaxID=151895 RepID=UPI000A01916D|nr:FeoB-associated Cys-rich membrane protein [Pseudopedobacter saltans]